MESHFGDTTLGACHRGFAFLSKLHGEHLLPDQLQRDVDWFDDCVAGVGFDHVGVPHGLVFPLFLEGHKAAY